MPEHDAYHAAFTELAASMKAAGFEKQAYMINSILRNTVAPGGFLWPAVLGGGLGALFGPTDHRTEGAIAGIIGGTIGNALLRSQGRRLAAQFAGTTPEVKATIARGSAKQLEALLRTNPALAESVRKAEHTIGQAGTALGASGGGYALRAKEQADQAQGLTEPQPVMYDLGGKYTGFMPDELNDASLLGL